MKRLSASAAVDKIKERRKPEDFIGHRKRALLRSIFFLKAIELAPWQMKRLSAITSLSYNAVGAIINRPRATNGRPYICSAPFSSSFRDQSADWSWESPFQEEIATDRFTILAMTTNLSYRAQSGVLTGQTVCGPELSAATRRIGDCYGF